MAGSVSNTSSSSTFTINSTEDLSSYLASLSGTGASSTAASTTGGTSSDIAASSTSGTGATGTAATDGTATTDGATSTTATDSATPVDPTLIASASNAPFGSAGWIFGVSLGEALPAFWRGGAYVVTPSGNPFDPNGVIYISSPSALGGAPFADLGDRIGLAGARLAWGPVATIRVGALSDGRVTAEEMAVGPGITFALDIGPVRGAVGGFLNFRGGGDTYNSTFTGTLNLSGGLVVSLQALAAGGLALAGAVPLALKVGASTMGVNAQIGLNWNLKGVFENGELKKLLLNGEPFEFAGGLRSFLSGSRSVAPPPIPNNGDPEIANTNFITQFMYGSSPWDVALSSGGRNFGNGAVSLANGVYAVGRNTGQLAPGERITSNAQAGQIIQNALNRATTPAQMQSILNLVRNRYDIDFGVPALEVSNMLLGGGRPGDYQFTRNVFQGNFRNPGQSLSDAGDIQITGPSLIGTRIDDAAIAAIAAASEGTLVADANLGVVSDSATSPLSDMTSPDIAPDASQVAGQYTLIEPWDAGPLAPAPTWDDKLTKAVLSSMFETDDKGRIKFDADGKTTLKATADVAALSVAIGVAKAEAALADPSVNAADAVAKLLVQTLDAVDLTSAEGWALEKSVRNSVIDDSEVLGSLATLQLDIVKANGATLTPYQEGVFLQKFKELVPAQTIDEARANALLAARAAPANPPGTNPDGQVNRGDFNFRNALFVLSASGYRSDPVYVDSEGNSFQDFIRNGLNDDNPNSMEISSYTLRNGQLWRGGASTTLDDGSYATVNFDEKGFSVLLPNGQRYSGANWYDDITEPNRSYRGYATPSDPLGIQRFKALTEGTTPPAMPSAPPATTPPATPPALPEPQPLPGSTPNDKGLNDPDAYPVASLSEGGRIASTLLQNTPYGSFALLIRDKGTGQYWVTGPYAGNERVDFLMTNLLDRFEQVTVVENGRATLPAAISPPSGRPAGELNARFYQAENARDAGRIAELAYAQSQSDQPVYFMLLRDTVTRQLYVDGPFPAVTRASDAFLAAQQSAYASANLEPLQSISVIPLSR
jgi:hypothetical protein